MLFRSEIRAGVLASMVRIHVEHLDEPLAEEVVAEDAVGDHLLVFHAYEAAVGRDRLVDESTPIGEVDKLLAQVEQEGYDLAIGSRAAPGAQVAESQAWYRNLAGKLFGLATRLLCVRGVRDTQCGFKLLKNEVAQKVFPQVTSPSAIFDIEMLVVATRQGYRLAEVPVRWVHDPDTRIPYDLRRALKIWMELFRIRRVQQVRQPMKVNQ